MATDKEYQALIKALSGECERLHKAIESIRAEIADLDDAEYEFEGYYKAVNDAVQIIDKYRKDGD